MAGLAAGVAPAAQAQDAARGEAVFKRLCAQCHNVDGGRMPIAGPTLKAVAGRKAGSIEGFRSYSAGLRDSGIVWDEATLNAFLAEPKKAVSGTSHAVQVRTEAERAALIAYLSAAR
jgi:cytochrome c